MEQQIETVKQSEYTANTAYDYRKLEFPQEYLMELKIKVEKEEMHLSYDYGERKCMTELRKEDPLTILAVLMNITVLEKGLKEYQYSLEPDNLYYDRDHKVVVKRRDIYAAGGECGHQEYIDSYLSLIGYAMQVKYSYKDYKNGGMQLLAKHPFLKRFQGVTDTNEIQEILNGEYEKIKKEQNTKYRKVKRTSYRTLTVAVAVLGIISIGLLVYLGYRLWKTDPYNQAVIAADNAYIESDYVACIEAMEPTPVSDMETTQKYILAASYVRSESLSQEQRENILSKLSINASSDMLEYWIYLGRGDTEQAVDIAMRQSDNQLLLYAYMKQKAAVEADKILSGEEKGEQLEALESKMEPLIEQYEAEEEKNESGNEKAE